MVIVSKSSPKIKPAAKFSYKLVPILSHLGHGHKKPMLGYKH